MGQEIHESGASCGYESKVVFKKKKKSVDEGYVQRAQEPNKKAQIAKSGTI